MSDQDEQRDIQKAAAPALSHEKNSICLTCPRGSRLTGDEELRLPGSIAARDSDEGEVWA
jgi:hypothetical protein